MSRRRRRRGGLTCWRHWRCWWLSVTMMSRWMVVPNDDSSSFFPLFLCVSSSLGFFFFISPPFFCLSFSFASCSFPIPLFLSSLSLFLYFFSFGLFCSFSSLLLSLSSLFSVSPVFLSPLLSACWVGYLYDRGSGSYPTFVESWRQGRVAGVASVQSPQLQSIASLSNLHHGGRWGAWVVSGFGQVGRGRKREYGCCKGGEEKPFSLAFARQGRKRYTMSFKTVHESVSFWTKHIVSF